jgi:hypothetical protein
MGVIVQLPDNAHALLRDPSQVSERLRRPIMAAVSRLAAGVDMTGKSESEIGTEMLASGGMDTMNEVNDLLVVALVESWSYPQPITLDGVLDLPGVAYDALRTAVSPHMGAMMPSFDVKPDTAGATPGVPSDS